MNEIGSIWNPKKPQETEKEELAVRAMFREKSYLSLPLNEREHVSISQEKLNPELRRFCALSVEKYTQFVDAVVTHNEEVRQEKACAVKWLPNQPVAVTYEEVLESEKLENHTIMQLKLLIEDEITKISVDSMKEEWKELWDVSVKDKSKKNDYVEFLKELQSFNSTFYDDDSEDDHYSDDDS